MNKATIRSRATAAAAAAATQKSRFRFGDFGLIAVVVALGIFLAHHFSSASGEAGVLAATKSFVTHDLDTALQAYKNDVGRFPTAAQGLTALTEQPENVSNWKGPYVADSAALRDNWNMPYQYANPSRHHGVGQYDAWSMGPDKKSGTTDDVTNW